MKRRTKNFIAIIAFAAVCVIPIVVISLWSYMVASGKTTEKVARWLSSQLDLKVHIDELRTMGPTKTASGVKVRDFQGERTILSADRLRCHLPSVDRMEATAEGAGIELTSEASAADLLSGFNKLLRAAQLKGLAFKGTEVKLDGVTKMTFSPIEGTVRIDGRNTSLDASGTGKSAQGLLTTLSVTAALTGRELQYQVELSREGGPFIAGALADAGELVASLVGGFEGNQIVRKTHERLTETFNEGALSVNLLGFYRRAGLTDAFNSFGKSFLTELVMDRGKIESFDVRVLATPGPDDRKVFSRRFLYTAHFLLTGKYLMAPVETEEFPFRELSFDVTFADGRYTVRGQLSVDGHWILLDEMALGLRVEVPPADGIVLTPETLAQRWATVTQYSKEGWPQESLPRSTAERIENILDYAVKQPKK